MGTECSRALGLVHRFRFALTEDPVEFPTGHILQMDDFLFSENFADQLFQKFAAHRIGEDPRDTKMTLSVRRPAVLADRHGTTFPGSVWKTGRGTSASIK